MAEQQKPKLGYWKIRGLAQPIRMLLKYTNTPFQDELYELGDAPEYSSKSWRDVKFTLGLDFPNLPYYIDGDFKITESGAIIRYIADKNNLLGKDPETRARVRMVEEVICTWRTQNSKAAYSPDFEGQKANLLKDVEAKYLQKFASILEKGPWVIGDETTFVDFMLYEYLIVAFAMDPSFKEKYPKLLEYTKKIEALPAIKSYMESAEYISYPFNNKIASWGGKGDSI
ncbi:Glutathione S-transferase Mu 3 [Oopsacas minuta]|uniref:glutathione transferase n=1 Tax=Oopsacas minuta TaxID=111878 RepID=A0AAV7JVI2_9METZ|nr:Glutathione S-transferase Mu 3 [Oopsacas minuta]